MIHRWSAMSSYHQIGIWKCKKELESMSSKILRSNLPFIQLSLIGNDPSMIVNVELSSSRDIKMQKKELESMLLKILRIYRLSNCHWLGMIHRWSSMLSYHQVGIWKCKQELESMLSRIFRIPLSFNWKLSMDDRQCWVII